MKHGTNPRRGRGRGNGGKRHSNPQNRTYESNGPDVKVRGTAQQVLEKYLLLARDASSSGDRIAAESYLQFAEHYYRVLTAAQQQQQANQQGQQQTSNNNQKAGPASVALEGEMPQAEEMTSDDEPEAAPEAEAEVQAEGEAPAAEEKEKKPVRRRGRKPAAEKTEQEAAPAA